MMELLLTCLNNLFYIIFIEIKVELPINSVNISRLNLINRLIRSYAFSS